MSSLGKKRKNECANDQSREPPLKRQRICEVDESRIKVHCVIGSGTMKYEIHYDDDANPVATVLGTFDEEEKRIRKRQITIECPDFDDDDYERPIRALLKHYENEKNQQHRAKPGLFRAYLIRQAIHKIVEATFVNASLNFNIVRISVYLWDYLRVDIGILSPLYDARHIGFYVYFLKKPRPNALFRTESLKQYVHPCTVLIKKKDNFIYNPSELQKNGIVPSNKMDLFISYLCRMSGVNYQEIPTAIVNEVCRWQAPKIDTLEFERRAMIVQDAGDGGYHILFETPFRLVMPSSGDICFKFMIEDTVITGNDFYFEAAGHHTNDWEYRIHRYADNIDPYCGRIESNHVNTYKYLFIKRSKRGYDALESGIKQSKFSVIKQGEDTTDWDEDLVSVLSKLLDRDCWKI